MTGYNQSLFSLQAVGRHGRKHGKEDIDTEGSSDCYCSRLLFSIFIFFISISIIMTITETIAVTDHY